MSLANIRNFTLVVVLGFLLSACATGGKKEQQKIITLEPILLSF
jgi:hypothetical protein